MDQDDRQNHADQHNKPSTVEPQQPSPNRESVSTSAPIEIKQAQGPSKQATANIRQTPDPDIDPIPIDSIIRTANTMSSLMMAHRIALEDDFKLEPGMDISGPMMSISPIIGSSPSKGLTKGGSHEPSLQSRVKDIVHDAYWDLFREELLSQKSDDKQERKFDLSKQLLRDIRQKILDLLLPQHAKLKQDVEDKLDLQIIDQLSKIESLDLREYAIYVINVLSKLCAPVRDERLKELSETEDIVALCRGIMELLELMRLDFANFTLNQFKPHIKAHSQDYEREKFNEILKQQQLIGIDGLEYTKIWLQRAVEKVDELHGLADIIEDNADQDDVNQPIMNSAPECNASSSEYSLKDKILRSDAINKILNVAYSELLEWTPEQHKLYPETLLFDESSFRQLSEQFMILLQTSSILLATFAFAAKFRLKDDNEFRVLTKSHVITLLTATYDNPSSSSGESASKQSDETIDQVKLETIAAKLLEDIKQKIQSSDKSLMQSFESQRELFKRQLLDLQSPTNRVRELARRRILEFVETLLKLDVKHQQKKITSKTVPPVSIPLGLNCLADEITLTMAQLVKIIRYNRRVFFQHYESIIVDSISKKL